ncbi:MAG: 2-oxoacid:acceptor oxidoreductase family protein [Myxococcales bacterium]|nr:2-oxoacid:acceptor oxidoreductase family protein [Myxococcales bacterium]
MLRIRFHGRGGQGMKTASRILGTALFLDGFEVQDAPRYGAERRGAPIFAYVRADSREIHERGIIDRPDLVVVADDSLCQVPAAGVRLGLSAQTVVLIRSREDAATWRERLRVPGPMLVLPASSTDDDGGESLLGAECVGAAARLLGVVTRDSLKAATGQELERLPEEVRARNVRAALRVFDGHADHAGIVTGQPTLPLAAQEPPRWIDLQVESADVAAPTIHAGGTSVQVRTGLWRTMRPVVDHERCHRCHWMCALPCPDNALLVDDAGYPRVDLDHCKGCMICVAQCPFHVIHAVPEHEAQTAERAEAGDA